MLDLRRKTELESKRIFYGRVVHVDRSGDLIAIGDVFCGIGAVENLQISDGRQWDSSHAHRFHAEPGIQGPPGMCLDKSQETTSIGYVEVAGMRT